MIQAQREQSERVMQAADRKIWITFRKEGVHRYPAAATDPALCTAGDYDVSFFFNFHPQIFHFRVSIDVFSNDRDIEFIQFKRWLESLYNNSNSILNLDYKSCEMIADDLYIQIAERYPNRNVVIEVSEDGENGCSISYNLTRPTHTIVI
jgi:hypothetical protein